MRLQGRANPLDGGRSRLGQLLVGLQDDERGQSLVEYALILMLVSTAAILALQQLADPLSTMLDSVAGAFP